MDDLIKRLEKKQAVEIRRPEKTVQAIQQSIERNLVHLHFLNTSTELGVNLDIEKCKINQDYFEKCSGEIHIEGDLILNFTPVRCVANIDLSTCEGEAYIIPN